MCIDHKTYTHKCEYLGMLAGKRTYRMSPGGPGKRQDARAHEGKHPGRPAGETQQHVRMCPVHLG